MVWTLELASKLEDAPWPATKEELLDYAVRTGAPMEVIENLQEIEEEEEKDSQEAIIVFAVIFIVIAVFIIIGTSQN